MRWLVEVGDRVTKGDPIAEVSTENPLLRRLAAKPTSTIKATDTGYIESLEPLVRGDVIGDIHKNDKGETNIAVIGPKTETPWWPWLLLVALLAMLICSCSVGRRRLFRWKHTRPCHSR